MLQPSREKILEYFKSHAHDPVFSKHYGAYMTPIFVQGFFGGVTARQILPYSMSHCMFFQNYTVDREFDWQWPIDEMKKTRAHLFSSLEADITFGKSFYEKYQNGFTIFDKRARLEEQCDGTKLSAPEIVEHLLQLIDAASHQAIGYTVDCLLSFSDDDWFAEHIQTYSPQSMSLENIDTLRTPTRRTFVNSYNLRLLEARHLQEKGEDISSVVEQIVKDYYWVENNYLKVVPKSLEQVMKEIEALNYSLAVYEEEKERVENIKKQKQKILDDVQATPLLRAFVQFADDCTFIQDCRKQAVLRLNHFILHYLDYLADILQVDHELTKYVMFYELEDFVKSPQEFLQKAKERQAGCFVVFDESGYAIFSRDELKRIDLSNFFPDLSSVVELKGMCASPGKVQGRACVVLGSDQFSLFQPGDILITNQTTPDFVPLMKKAGAIVAEQGGVTSHAAIVSRELGVPCIVGAKKAMSVFQTGDMVEVDAMSGVVKKL